MASVGDRLDGKYLIRGFLGRGGFGEVYLAEDEEIPGRHVAIKVLLEEPDGDYSDLIWEMKQLSQITHHHVVAFYHHFRESGRLYLVMEYCPGGDLKDALYKRECSYLWSRETNLGPTQFDEQRAIGQKTAEWLGVAV